MKTRLLALSVLGCALYSTAQDTAPPPVPAEPGKAETKTTSSTASTSIQMREGKIVVETEVNGKKESRVLDLNDPATLLSLQGKAVVTVEKNGKKETRIVDLNEMNKMLPPFLFNEKPPQRTGPVTYLGVATLDVPRDVRAQLELPPETGLLIGAIDPESPAAKAGLQESDVLCRLDDQVLITQRQLAVLIANHKEGDQVKLTYFRKGQQMEAMASLIKRVATPPPEPADALGGNFHPFIKPAPNGGVHPPGLSPEEVLKQWNHLHEAAKDSESDAARQIRRALKDSPELRALLEKELKAQGAKNAEETEEKKP